MATRLMFPKKKKRKLSISSLVKKADRVFSIFVRKRDGFKCVTCGGPGNHAGHYIRRSHKKARWHPQNVHCQCVRCNTFLDGNMDAYALFLVNEYGVELLEELTKLKGPYKPTREELEKIIEAYS